MPISYVFACTIKLIIQLIGKVVYTMFLKQWSKRTVKVSFTDQKWNHVALLGGCWWTRSWRFFFFFFFYNKKYWWLDITVDFGLKKKKKTIRISLANKINRIPFPFALSLFVIYIYIYRHKLLAYRYFIVYMIYLFQIIHSRAVLFNIYTYLKNLNNVFFFFLRESFNLWHPLLTIALYYQIKTPINFWYRWELNPLKQCNSNDKKKY